MKKSLLSVLLFCLAAVCAAEVKIDCEFPGGNIRVDSMQDGVVRVRPDLRDSNDWFYYAFRVRDAEGQTLRFVFNPGCRVGARGPAMSFDEGKTWRYLSDKPGFSQSEFTYTFAPGENSVLFAQAILYTQQNWDEWRAKYADRSEMQFSTLCRSRKGRDVELLRFGNPSGTFGLGLTCRHHCCEMIASYVLEGFLDESLADSEDGRWLRENVSFFVVPFIDKDGVEDGDQGKGRRPHDHNRDYNHEIYPEIKALKAQLAAAFEGKKIAFFDFHCPWIRSGMNEYLYSPMGPNERMTAASSVYFKGLEEIQKSGEIPYALSNNLPYGKDWNNDATIEVPYSNSSDVEVTRENARELGRNMARAMVRFLKTQEN